MVIAIDFDGCITEKNIFPEIGKAREHTFEAIRKQINPLGLSEPQLHHQGDLLLAW